MILCRSHYLSTLDLSWNAMLNITKVEPDLISDVNMYCFFQKGTKGSVFYISKRYSKASKLPIVLKTGPNILLTWTKIIYPVMLCQNLFQQVHLSG